jgi:predicted oxidoreductase
LLPELRRSRVMDDDQADAIVTSVLNALRDLHPNVTVIDTAAVHEMHRAFSPEEFSEAMQKLDDVGRRAIIEQMEGLVKSEA